MGRPVSLIVDLFTIHTVSVATFLGAGATGDRYSGAVSVAGFLDDGVTVKRDASGEESTSQTTFYTSLGEAHRFTPESIVTLGDRVLIVEGVRYRDGGGLLSDVSHLEVTFQ